MTKVKLFLVLLLTSLLVISCEDAFNENNSSNNDFAKNFGNATSKDFMGQVVDEDNNPIQNVAVKIGSTTAQTDVNGVFIINSANVYERFAYITAKKAGFIDGSRAVVPSSGTNRVKIMMLSGNVLATVSSGTTSEAALPNGTKVIFDGNFKTETGSAYSGNVSVIVHHLDPSDPNIADKMPGMLFAESTNGEAKVLETFGMMNVELRGSGGEKLQIANTAQIEMPITAAQLTTAPVTIPLWHFDETLGYWKEEGSATKQGNKYVGTVSHFSWWNCDMQFSSILLTVNLVDANGNPISNVRVGIIRSGNSYPVMGFTNNDGQVCGFVPANETLTMNIYDNCGNVVLTSSIGPFSSNTILPNIVLDANNYVLVSGNLLKCNNSVVTNGYVIIYNEEYSFIYYVDNGIYNIPVFNCNGSIDYSIFGVDLDENKYSNTINSTFVLPNTSINNLFTCIENTCNNNLAGNYKVTIYKYYVTLDSSPTIYNIQNETIYQVYNNYYKTSTTGTYPNPSIPDQGFNFLLNCDNGNVLVPTQNLFSTYSNIVRSFSPNGIDGNVLDNNNFQIKYEILFATGSYFYICNYTRN